ncbi:hypothetical protein FGO68_gene7277 [Halteria grandinella]|uniref:Uncharacterized protein n=1 Tax=Halteria grandinella TaxID=5974 RepID=A0A8J8NAR0_HALGN|nr:hypothetical protein FGO68_gene7277 [Halteria grandinella]
MTSMFHNHSLLLPSLPENHQMTRQSEFNRKSAPQGGGNRRPSEIGSRKRQIKLIFKDVNTQQELTEDAQLICKQLALNPAHLKLKAYAEFAEQGISQTVQEVRYKHYNEKRLYNLTMIEEMLRVADAGSTLYPRSSTLYSLGNRDGLKSNSVLGGKKSILLMHNQTRQQNFMQPVKPQAFYGGDASPDGNQWLNTSSLTTITPDIPLREPLEFEYRLNRKLAKQIYQQEKQERVLSNKQREELEKIQKQQSLIKEYTEKEKKFMKDKREIEEAIQHKHHKIREKREMTQHKRQQMMQEREFQLRAKEQKIKAETEKFKTIQDNKKQEKQEELFRIDLERELDKRDKNGRFMQIKQKEQREIEQRMRSFEDKLHRYQQNHELIFREKTEKRHQYAIDQERLVKLAEEQRLEGLLKTHKTIQKTQKFEEARKDLREARLYKQEMEKEKKRQQREAKLREIRESESTKRGYLIKRQKERSQAIEGMRNAWREDNEQKKEIYYLRRLDQQENLTRTKNFYLADKVFEKMYRAQSIKENREQVKTAYSSQLHNITMYNAARQTMREKQRLNNSSYGLTSGFNSMHNISPEKNEHSL